MDSTTPKGDTQPAPPPDHLSHVEVNFVSPVRTMVEAGQNSLLQPLAYALGKLGDKLNHVEMPEDIGGSNAFRVAMSASPSRSVNNIVLPARAANNLGLSGIT